MHNCLANLFINSHINGFRDTQPMGEPVTWELQKIIYVQSIVEVNLKKFYHVINYIKNSYKF